MKYLLTLICACLLVVGCSKDHNGDDPTPKTKARRTVIVYISADNNLSSWVSTNLYEMINGSTGIPSDCHLLLYVDRANTSDMPCVMEIKDQKTDTVFVADEDTYASNPEVMRDALIEIMEDEDYVADEYGLVLWGHASGWIIENDTIAYTRAYGVDNGKYMNIPTLSYVLGSLNTKFKFIFADCCCFQCVESAYELRNTTDYIIASPAEIPAKGAPYEKVVPALFSFDDDFYKDIVDAYATQSVNSRYEPLSVVKTSEMENLAQATAPLLQRIAENGGIEKGNGVAYYYSYFPYGSNYKLFYDVQDLFMNYIDDENLYNNWKAAFDKAVIYKNLAYPWVSDGFVYFNNFTLTDDNYGGISIFVPASYYPSKYLNGIKKMSWYYATDMDEYFSGL